MQESPGRKPLAASLMAVLALAGCATQSAVQPQARGGSPARMRADPEVEAQAAAFESFMRKAGAIDPAFSGPAAVGQALQTGAGYDPKQLEAGMVAFAAVAALQDPAFVAGVRRQGRDAKAGRELERQLAARPDTALALPGADAAASRARAALFRQGAGLAEGGQKVKAASYTLQRQAWAKTKVSDAPGRLIRVKAVAKAVYRPTGDDQARLYRSVAETGARGGAASPVVARGVALAALTALGDGKAGAALLAEPKSGMCVRVAKLNFHQCLASAGPYYEDIYCLGQHAMIEPAQCVAAAAGAPPPAKRRG
jgi:hypothetical protein